MSGALWCWMARPVVRLPEPQPWVWIQFPLDKEAAPMKKTKTKRTIKTKRTTTAPKTVRRATKRTGRAK